MEIRIKPLQVTLYTSIARAIEIVKSDLPSACYFCTIDQSLIIQRSISDSKACLLIWLQKCQNPHENRSSKVIAHWQYFYMGPQHKSARYELFIIVSQDVLHTDLLQPQFISCRWALGAGGNVVITEIYLSQSRFQP